VRILAIRFARLGDIILLLPALSQLKKSFPESHLTFLTGHRCAPLAGLCPAIDDVISLDRIALRDGSIGSAIFEMGRLVRDVRRRRFDLVVDFHSFRETNLLARLSDAPRRVALKRHNAPYLSFCFNSPPVVEDKSIHVGEMFHRVVAEITGNVSRVRERVLIVPEEMKRWAGQAMHGAPHLALYIDAPVRERIWPPEYFAKVADFAIEKFRARVAVISSNEGRPLASRVHAASRHPGELSVFTDVGIPQLAALIDSSRVLVSNDTGPMHLGPALGVPTLALFSVGYPEHFRPTGPTDRFLRESPIERIEVGKVIDATEQMWATAADPNFRR
jgi:lipopolysaccharide heptosyltransferase I